MDRLNTLISTKNYSSILDEYKTQVPHFIVFLGIDNCSRILTPPDQISVKFLCNWTDSRSLTHTWRKLSPNDDGRWGKIHFCLTDTPDFWVIINRPGPYDYYDPKRTIVCQMEPNMGETPHWGEWSNPDPNKFLKVITHDTHLNPLEWHLGQKHSDLLTTHPHKTLTISAILSDKYTDPGHKKRIDFVKALEKELPVDVYGNNRFNYRNYKGPLPYHEKDLGLMPYKYTIAAENHSIPNYFTEKLVDAILSECLCFYWGCPNLSTYIDERAYIRLELDCFETDIDTVKRTIAGQEWEKRIEFIRTEKHKILNDLQFLPFIHKQLNLNP